MTERIQAIELISDLISVETTLSKQANSPGRGITKKALREEKSAISNLFRELCGAEPTDAEIEELTQ